MNTTYFFYAKFRSNRETKYLENYRTQKSEKVAYGFTKFNCGKRFCYSGHGNEPVFPMFLHKSLWTRSLTLTLKPFQFWLRILGDIHIGKSTPRISESGVDKIAWFIHFFQTFVCREGFLFLPCNN